MKTPGQQRCIGAYTLGDDVLPDQEQRRRHHYIAGQTGTGKSTLLLNLIAQDLAAGQGLALLDPRGDLAQAALEYIPRSRTNDLVYTAAAGRRVFHLCADEFQSFATESFALILSEARKYALTLTIGHQYLDQLPDRLRSAVSARRPRKRFTWWD